MELRRPHSSEILQRVVPPITIWAITQILGLESVSEAVDRVDRRLEARKQRAVKSLSRVGRNAQSNPLLLYGGMIAVVAGVAMIARAASTRK